MRSSFANGTSCIKFYTGVATSLSIWQKPFITESYKHRTWLLCNSNRNIKTYVFVSLELVIFKPNNVYIAYPPSILYCTWTARGSTSDRNSSNLSKLDKHVFTLGAELHSNTQHVGCKPLQLCDTALQLAQCDNTVPRAGLQGRVSIAPFLTRSWRRSNWFSK
jgi:hypothetical protein